MGKLEWWNAGVVSTVGIFLGAVATMSGAAICFGIMENASPNDWLGFAGGVLGGAIGGLFTMFAGVLAWKGAQDQIRQISQGERAQRARAVGLLRMYIDGALNRGNRLRISANKHLKNTPPDHAQLDEWVNKSLQISLEFRDFPEYDEIQSIKDRLPLRVFSPLKAFGHEEEQFRLRITEIRRDAKIKLTMSHSPDFIKEEVSKALGILAARADEIKRELDIAILGEDWC